MTRAVPLEEPCAGQLACTVLQTSGGSDPFAEFNHAVKRFAYYRETADGQFSEAGLNEYLVLLSIYLTCRYKRVSFLKFLLSQEKDIDAFCQSVNVRRALPTVELCPEGFVSSRRKRKPDWDRKSTSGTGDDSAKESQIDQPGEAQEIVAFVG
jgi:hypothetical protein